MKKLIRLVLKRIQRIEVRGQRSEERGQGRGIRSYFSIPYSLYAICYLLFAIPCLYGAFEEKISSARNAALGGAGVALLNDSNLIFFNPAGLGQLPGVNFSFSQTSLFGISDLSCMVMSVAVPTRRFGSFGFAYSQFGPSMYRETEIAILHSFALGRNFLFGYNIRNQSVNIKNFGTKGGIGVDIGVYSGITSNLAAGFSIKNINSPRLGATAESLPQNYRVGIVYYPEVGVAFLLDMSKDLIADELSYHAGGELNITENFVFRSGIRTNPSRFSTGFGVVFGVFRLNYAMMTHPILDAQHFFSLAVRFGADTIDVAPERHPERRRRRREATRRPRAEVQEDIKNLRIDINKASAEDFDQIPGIGALTAQRIIDYREEHGPFKSISDLQNIPRITKRKFEKMRPFLVLDGEQRHAPEGINRGREVREEKPEITIEPPPARAPEITPEIEDIEYPSEPDADDAHPVDPVITPTEAQDTQVEYSELLDINRASAMEFQVIGFTASQSGNIVRHRNRVGRFNSVDDILLVPGVDARTFESARELMTVR